MKLSNLLKIVPGLMCLSGAGLAASEIPLSDSPARWIPEQALLCAEVFRPAEVADALLSAAAWERFAALPVIEKGKQTEDFQGLMGLVRYVELTTQTNWQSVVRSVTRNGMAFGVGSEARYLAVLDGADAELLEKLHDLARGIAANEAQKQGRPEEVDVVHMGSMTGWTFNGREAHVVLGSRLLAASDREVLQAAVDLTQQQGGSLAEREDYQAGRRAVGGDALGMVFVDLARLRASPKVRAALDAPANNPLAALVLADLPEMFRSAPWLAAGVYLEGGVLSVRVFTGEALHPPETIPFPTDVSSGCAVKLGPPVAGQVARLTLSRDLAGFYAAKDDLFPQRTSGLIFFENMMGIFFSGRNLTDDVLASTNPDMRLVVARQVYDRGVGVPEPQLPGFALVVGLKDPEGFGEVLEEAWQKALGLINFTRGQKAQPGLILDRTVHRGTPMTVAAFSSRAVEHGKPLPMRYNFRPTLAVAHGAAILSSTDRLARDLMDAMSRENGPRSGEVSVGPHTVLELAGLELQKAFQANRDAMIRNNMIQEGKTYAEAETGIDTLISIVGWFDSAEMAVGGGQRGERVNVRFSVRPPE